jgi:hypothetical protein
VTAEQQPELTVVEALELAADAPKLVDRLRVTTSGRIIHGPSLWPTKSHPVKVGFLRWLWSVTDPQTGDVLASGHRPSKPWAWHASEAAAYRIYTERLAAAKATEEES